MVNHNNQPQLQFLFIYTCLLPILVLVVDGGVGLLNHTLPVV